MSCTTTADEHLSRYILKRVRRSSNFHRDILRAAPVPRRKGETVIQHVKSTGGGSPLRYLEKPGDRVHLRDELVVNCSDLHVVSPIPLLTSLPLFIFLGTISSHTCYTIPIV
jgi:hypothetical protein